MIDGIGLDIVELDRIARLDEKSAKFRERILTSKEIAFYTTYSPHRKIEFLAGRFAAKEAFAKAKGTGIGSNCSFDEIEILKDSFGKPVLYFRNEVVSGFVSITHTATVAAAQVILVK